MKKKIEDMKPKKSIRSIPIPRRGNDEELYEKEFSIDESKLEKEIEKERSSSRATRSEKSVQANYSHIHYAKLNTPSHRNRYEDDAIVDDNDSEKDDDISDTSRRAYSSYNQKGKKRSRFWLLALLIIAGVGYMASTTFSHATISISPSNKTLSLQNQPIDLKEVTHEVILEKFSQKATVKVAGTKKVDEKATGKVILYNNFSSASQKIVKNTRLETPEGLIFLVVNDVTIPGTKTVSGKKTAGSVEASVIASQSGDKYNVGMKDFAFVAYKGTDRYKLMYGRSKTALAGGYSGTVPDISDTDVALTIKSLKKLIAEAVDSKYTALALKKKDDATAKGTPYIYIPKSYLITYSEPKQILAKDGKTAEITLDASVLGILFDKNDLTSYISDKTTASSVGTSTATSTQISTKTAVQSAGQKSYTIDFDKVNMTVSASTTLTMLNTNEGTLLASGTTTISSTIDESALVRSVSRLDKDQAQEVLRNLIDFSSLEINIVPFWVHTMPKIDNIEIKLVS